MFKKLDLPCVKPERGEFRKQYGPIQYFNFIGKLDPIFYALEFDYVQVVEISGPRIAIPHRDHGINVNLNLYYRSGNATTHFWKETPASEARVYQSETIANIYDEDTLEHVDSFTAADGDAFLLDVQQIHSVQMLPDNVRIFVQLSWTNQTYDYVLSRTQELLNSKIL